MSDATKQDFYTIFVNRQTYFGMPVSIHAPAWGATYRSVRDNLHGGISIHAPAWGATRDNQSVVGREGISIHAPAWGATRPCFWSPRIAAFQSTHPRGVRRSAFQSPSARLIFQSTHPRGVRHTGCPAGVDVRYFNPRTRVGCDPIRRMRR